MLELIEKKKIRPFTTAGFFTGLRCDDASSGVFAIDTFADCWLMCVCSFLLEGRKEGREDEDGDYHCTDL